MKKGLSFVKTRDYGHKPNISLLEEQGVFLPPLYKLKKYQRSHLYKPLHLMPCSYFQLYADFYEITKAKNKNILLFM